MWTDFSKGDTSAIQHARNKINDFKLLRSLSLVAGPIPGIVSSREFRLLFTNGWTGRKRWVYL